MEKTEQDSGVLLVLKVTRVTETRPIVMQRVEQCTEPSQPGNLVTGWPAQLLICTACLGQSQSPTEACYFSLLVLVCLPPGRISLFTNTTCFFPLHHFPSPSPSYSMPHRTGAPSKPTYQALQKIKKKGLLSYAQVCTRSIPHTFAFLTSSHIYSRIAST